MQLLNDHAAIISHESEILLKADRTTEHYVSAWLTGAGSSDDFQIRGAQ
jgi:hypothetical protein